MTNQLQIAKCAGIYVGAVNLLLKEMVQEGLVMYERLNAQNFRYMLTPKGMKEKARLTYNIARSSYRQVMIIRDAVKALVEGKAAEFPLKEVILFGPDDEIREIIKTDLSGSRPKYICIEDKEALDIHLERKTEGSF